ncbi:MAG: circularly permuted type 2 ATP-grasp protein [Xanthobacteraceae bacterium]|nr:circularly permuted type 2 ATP-grasp protein [Xanthobacteraceae bacterium]
MAHLDSASRAIVDPEAILSGYKPRAGNFDEMMDADGRVREHWRPFLRMLAELGPAEVDRRFAAADRHLRDSGVFYRVYEDPSSAVRPWPLSHIPLLIDAKEWRALKVGLIQRAELLEAILKDIYGLADLVRDGRLPASVVAGNPEFLRPLVGAAPAGGSHLRFYAVDVGRSPEGLWWVLGDRTQAPSGAGYALENRIALSRAMPDVYRALHVERLAPFFQAFQAELSALNRQDDSRVCVLTPGPLNETYFEHAYLARYLGFLLVEGEDLTVREDGVFIRTVSGLKRAEVLLRRLDADFADPLELSARSRLGVPGLVQAVRDGTVTIANALGSGVVEARAMLSFLPALAPAVLGQELAIPNLATWWLGDLTRRSEVLEKLDSVVIGSAFAGDNADHSRGAHASELVPGSRNRLIEAIGRRGADFVAQEVVTLSTTPAWQDGKLVPRPFILRLMLARVGDGWRVMPGGFVRVADDADARAVSLQQGGRTADAWVLSDKPVHELTLLPTPDRIEINRATGALPSRAAANLFWLGRYVERTEATLRLVRALLNRATESDEAAFNLHRGICSLLAAWGAVPGDMLNATPALVASAALRGRDFTGAVPFLGSAAQQAASVIRERFSPDAWCALTDLVELINAPLEQGLNESALTERANGALRIIASFSGLAQENMSQLAGWRYLKLGRRIERALAGCRFVRQFAFANDLDGALDVLLELADSQITYRLRYVMVAARAPVVDLVALDPNNPRSIVFQLARIEAHLAALPKRGEENRLSPPEQIATAATTRLRTTEAAQIGTGALLEVEAALMKLSDVVASTYFTTHARSDGQWDALG